LRRIAAQLQTLRAANFVLVIALVAGVTQGLPRLFLGGTVSTPRLTSFLIVGSAGILWWIAAFLLWWIAVRRQQSSLWSVAAQVTVGLVVGEFFAGALGLVVDSINTHGEVATLLGQHVSDVVLSQLTVTLLRSPLWFIGAALAIALGRHLNQERSPLAAAASPGRRPGAVI
jgi:hypothetical protein